MEERLYQKLNCSSSLVPGPGRFVSTSRNVRSNGIVTDESVELRLIKFSPGFTTICVPIHYYPLLQEYEMNQLKSNILV